MGRGPSTQQKETIRKFLFEMTLLCVLFKRLFQGSKEIFYRALVQAHTQVHWPSQGLKGCSYGHFTSAGPRRARSMPYGAGEFCFFGGKGLQFRVSSRIPSYQRIVFTAEFSHILEKKFRGKTFFFENLRLKSDYILQ